MGEWVERYWIPADGPALSRKDKLGGFYHAYVPDLLTHKNLSLSRNLVHWAADIEKSILELNRRESLSHLESIARLLMRSEAVSSSRIEGIAPAVDKVVLAELAQEEEVRGFKESAEAVARNLQVLRAVEEAFATSASVSSELLASFQAKLLGPGAKVPLGVRRIQNWIGGSGRTPLAADFVPPPPEEVPGLLEDLCSYINGAYHGALIQTALVHAQFETIHPFADGNGRVGRALIHGTLRRRGLTTQTILPVSLVLGTWSQRYVEGLSAFRNGDDETWLRVFFEAVEQAVEQANLIGKQLVELHDEWRDTIARHRRELGLTRALRTDSVEFKLLNGLPAHPILTTRSVERMYGIKPANGRKALENLKEAGILRAKVIGKHGAVGYYADDILTLITLADRKLASSRCDTRLSPPVGRAAPELPQRP